MIRILGHNLSNRKKLYIALTAIYGIGIPTAKKILQRIGIPEEKKIPDLNEKVLSELRTLLEGNEYQLEGNLRRKLSFFLRRLREINCYRGKRHNRSLPVRGQRTRTNSRTVRRTRKVYSSKPTQGKGKKAFQVSKKPKK
jgi:small subunit ribosomal protein S13